MGQSTYERVAAAINNGTPRVSPETLQNALEALVDASNLWAVTEALASVARLKARHIDETWQDRTTARVWEAASVRIQMAADSTRVRALAD